MLLLSLKFFISVLKRKTSLGLMLKHETSTARVEINSTRALPVIARAWLRHWCHPHLGLKNNKQNFIFNASRDWKPMEMFLDVVGDMGVTGKSGNESCSC